MKFKKISQELNDTPGKLLYKVLYKKHFLEHNILYVIKSMECVKKDHFFSVTL